MMMMARLVSLLLAALVTRHVTAIDTVPQLNITQYLGTWYQVYGNLIVDEFTERHCKCVMAHYGALSNGSISVLNACRLKSPDGELNTIRGYAFRPDDKEQGKIEVVFGGKPIGGTNYWVVQLGPPTFNGTYYQYSVVTDPFSANLFVLARNVTEFKQKYDEDVTTILKQQGFTKFYNKPIETYQGNDCMYIKPF
ncbi:apolipoprotein D-like isoform X2 [Dysidea avara]|uniref:apolipoprotein D-like isoform X2 n=1 Tax=Dysidea avara TaxID=196820 RepID=UPI00333213F2